jgi:hypothetical protein
LKAFPSAEVFGTQADVSDFHLYHEGGIALEMATMYFSTDEEKNRK